MDAEARDRIYTEGHRRAWLTMLSTCLRELGIDDPVAGGARWVIERQEAIATLRIICGEEGDNDWPDDLHLSDILNKHLFPYIASGAK